MGTVEERLRDGKELGWDEFRTMIGRVSAKVGEWAGIPIPLNDFRLRVEERYPWKEIETLLVAPSRAFVCGETEPAYIRNAWYSRRRGGYVTLYQQAPDPKVKVLFNPQNRSAERLTYLISTAGCMDAWDFDAEVTAMEKLEPLVSRRMFEMYVLTGTFLETSKRSRVTYLFRRLRPTVAMVGIRHDNPDLPMRCLAVLCLHPTAYYERTWGGAMVPTDDVIAHLMMMRADEHGFWKRANHHDHESPEAGL